MKHPRPIDIGTVFFRLTIIGPGVPQSRSNGYFCQTSMCQCSCGAITMVRNESLRSGRTVSCGCYAAEVRIKHGKRKFPEYDVWNQMKQRCHNPSHPMWSYYGERGIIVCERWRESFENFILDMGRRPEGGTIERIDNDAGYSIENCRWATRREQLLNRRTNRMVSFYGKSMTATEWSEISQIRLRVILNRIRRGWCDKEAFWTPPMKRPKVRGAL